MRLLFKILDKYIPFIVPNLKYESIINNFCINISQNKSDTGTSEVLVQILCDEKDE